MTAHPWQRPESLLAVAEGSHTYTDFGLNLRDFLHAWEQARRTTSDLSSRLAEAPPLLASRFPEGDVCDAFLAATADHLSRTNHLHSPIWALHPDRVLARPWFSEEFPQVRLRLLRDTPSAFKDKNLFVFESALRVG